MNSLLIPKKKPKVIQAPPLKLFEDVSLIEDSTETLTFTLKQRAGNSTGDKESTYKRTVKRFDQGSVTEWIDTRKALKEIWTQNSVESATDMDASIRTII